MKLISASLSLFAKKVEIALAEKAIDCQRELAAFSQTAGYSPRHPDVLAHNPKRQVPVLIDGDFVLYDSTVIIEYLEDLKPSPPLYPTSPRERARCRLLELYADEVILAPLKELMHRNEPGAKSRADWAAREETAKAAEAVLENCYRKIFDETLCEFMEMVPAREGAPFGRSGRQGNSRRRREAFSARRRRVQGFALKVLIRFRFLFPDPRLDMLAQRRKRHGAVF